MNAANVTLNFILYQPRNTYILSIPSLQSFVLNGFLFLTTKKTECRLLFSGLEMLVSVGGIYWSKLGYKYEHYMAVECMFVCMSAGRLGLRRAERCQFKTCSMNHNLCGINIGYNDLELWLTEWQTIDAIQVSV